MLYAVRHCTDPREEAANSFSHALGMVLAIVALIAMLVVAAERMDPWRIAGATVHGSALVALFASSAIYHALPVGWWKNVFQTADHMLIYAVIAGTWTPFLLVSLDGVTSWTLLGLQWGTAFAGMVLKVLYGPMRLRTLSLVLYIGMGLVALPLLWPLASAVPLTGLVWLGGGGALYLTGVIFFQWDSLPYNHFLWHLFVLGGAGCHVAAVLGYVLPA